MSAISDLKRLASQHELQVVDSGTGHLRVIGGLVVIHWWPLSKRRTVWADGAPRGHHNATAKNVINLAVKGTLT